MTVHINTQLQLFSIKKYSKTWKEQHPSGQCLHKFWIIFQAFNLFSARPCSCSRRRTSWGTWRRGWSSRPGMLSCFKNKRGYFLLNSLIRCSDDLFYWFFFIQIHHTHHTYSSKKERQDIEDLEVPETKRLFLQQTSFESQKSKEEKEYLDAINKEVTKWTKSHLNKIVVT